ncbi:MAG: acyl-CoA/acyl-ACP dehydrogenase [Phycisphaerae bacterium]|nr:acyl-CoA/acyl-ACP dehydrogenase [Phycisphaerae bacterium]
MNSALDQLTARLARLATHFDMTSDWPAESLECLGAAGAWTWIIPTKFGGIGLPISSQMQAYEAVAAGCLSCALILTQRDGAAEFIAESENDAAKADLLPSLAMGKRFASIGISHLTTSRQGGKPALTAQPDGDGFVLTGYMPWVTAADHCDLIVTGAVVPDGSQVLVWVPTDTVGVQIDPPMRLAALQSSHTSEVHCRQVRIKKEHVLRRPCDNALRRGSPVKSMVVSVVGMGLAKALVRDIERHTAGEGGALRELVDDAVARYDALRERVFSHVDRLADESADVPKTALRIAVNDLLMRLAITAVTMGKGSGFIRQRDTQRLAREAMFFLVWSAPEDVRSRTLSNMLDRPMPEIKSMGF